MDDKHRLTRGIWAPHLSTAQIGLELVFTLTFGAENVDEHDRRPASLGAVAL
jgi:hypothetical protein